MKTVFHPKKIDCENQGTVEIYLKKHTVYIFCICFTFKLSVTRSKIVIINLQDKRLQFLEYTCVPNGSNGLTRSYEETGNSCVFVVRRKLIYCRERYQTNEISN